MFAAYDDFFISEKSQGILVPIEMGGATLNIELKPGISFLDQAYAEVGATKTRINPQTNQVELEAVDEVLAMQELLFRCIRSWPFQYADGSPVPVTRESVAALRSEVALPLVLKLRELLGGMQQALDPFVKRLDAVTKPEDQPTP